MDEQRIKDYLDLIQQLLSCPRGEEPEILQGNAHLIDEDFVKAVEWVATEMAKQGDTNNAEWLQNVAQQLAEGSPSGNN